MLPPSGTEDACQTTKLTSIMREYVSMLGEDVESMSTHEIAEMLIVQFGWSQSSVARALGLTRQSIQQHWVAICGNLDAKVLPDRHRMLLALRLQSVARRGLAMTDQSKGLPIALKATEMEAKLFGLNLERVTNENEARPYTAPAEIAEDVRTRVLELHGRGSLVVKHEP